MNPIVEGFLTIKRILLKVLFQIGNLLGLNGTYVSILCYHDISSTGLYSVTLKNFRRQIKRMSHHSKFVSLDDCLDATRRRLGTGSQVCITFDDGYSNIMKVVPIIKQYNIPATVFVVSEPGRVNRRVLNNPHRLLSTKEIKKLHSLGWTIGCHSATHPAKMANPKQIKSEIISSKRTLEKKLGFPIHYYSYPKNYYSPEILMAVERAGYRGAFSIAPSDISHHPDRFLIPRTIVDGTHHPEEFPILYSPSTFLVRRIADKFKLWDRFMLAYERK